MTSIIKLIATCLCIFLSFPMQAAGSALLKFMGQPMDALCFYNLEKDTQSIDPKQCGLKHTKWIKTGQNARLINQGYTGYDWKDPAQATMQGYSYYKSFEAGNDAHWVFTLNNGGSNAEITDLYWVKKDHSDSLKIKHLVGGNRCNGGIQNVTKQNHHLRFSVNLTAFDLIALSKNHNPSIKAYDDLAACAVCCVAKAVYELKDSKPQLQAIDLGDTKNPDEMPNQGSYQTCFNALFTSYVRQGKNQLNPLGLEKFVEQFNRQCNGSQ